MISFSTPLVFASTLVMFAALAVLMKVRLATILGFYQQEEYDSRRFWRAWLRIPLLDFRATLGLVITVAIHAALGGKGIWAMWIYSGFLVWLSAREAGVNARAKKKLVMTERATRLYQLAAVLALLFALPVVFNLSYIWVWLQLPPALLMLANALLTPLQQRVNQRYMAEAQAKLADYPGKIIAITGSFGKTTSKHILGHALENLDSVFFSPGSINTVLGHTRHIRERLKPQDAYFIAEMGAYGPGSIQRLCDFIPPSLGMITAVGAAHYERFKSLETVAKAKAELGFAVLQNPDGQVYLHDSLKAYQVYQDMKAQAPERVHFCGPEQGSDVRLLQVETRLEGTQIVIERQGAQERYQIALLGEHNADNLVLIVALLRDQGFSAELIDIALRSMPQIAHRLERRDLAGYTLLDDAYNSNLIGFTSALKALDALGKQKGGRRILVTPGMAELGAQHDEQHAQIGALAGDCVDLLIAVRPDRIASLVEAAKSRGVEVLPVASFAEARAWIETQALLDDVILLENDLPDLLETRRFL